MCRCTASSGSEADTEVSDNVHGTAAYIQVAGCDYNVIWLSILDWLSSWHSLTQMPACTKGKKCAVTCSMPRASEKVIDSVSLGLVRCGGTCDGASVQANPQVICCCNQPLVLFVLQNMQQLLVVAPEVTALPDFLCIITGKTATLQEFISFWH